MPKRRKRKRRCQRGPRGRVRERPASYRTLCGPPIRYWTHFTGNHYKRSPDAEFGGDHYERSGEAAAHQEALCGRAGLRVALTL
jgi:hypothetical protein